ncbi:MAG: transcription elongation factor GreA [Thermoleophilia bacterium]|nr:transcription elongation factor GreA [Thermoleophilia bacterium]
MSGPGESRGPAGGESITGEGLLALEAELAELEGPAREQIAERLKAARALGDLKENADYHIAKEDQAHLETRIQRLRERQKNAVVADAQSDGAGDGFAFGRTALVVDPDGREHTWTLVGSTEANVAEGRLSAESPIGQALRNRPVGQQIVVPTPKGDRTFLIKKLL